MNALRRILGLRRSFVTGGVRYTERTVEPLHRSLSRKGPGFKEFDAEFPDGTRMLIRCTARRVFADLAAPSLMPVYRRAEPLVTPGMRALVIQSGTGYAPEWLAGLLGPSGAIVALDRDEESIRYARARYALGVVSFEVGGIAELSGETDGAFELVLAIGALLNSDDESKVLGELWRVVGRGGRLVVGAPRGEPGAAGGAPDEPRALTSAELTGRLTEICGEPGVVFPLGDDHDGWVTVAAGRTGDTPSSRNEGGQ